jgi:hypothetical protein
MNFEKVLEIRIDFDFTKKMPNHWLGTVLKKKKKKKKERKMGDTWGDFCTGSALFLFNGVDLICGTVLIVYSSYLGKLFQTVNTIY